jgi:diguanylate cyclase (GGDEF)-like protein
MSKKHFDSRVTNKIEPAMTNRPPSNYLPVFIDKINQSLISLTYHQANIGLLTALICASLIWYRLHSYVTGLNVDVWYATVWAITVLRASLVNIYLAQKDPEQRYKLWKSLFIISTTLGGITWGLVAFMLLPYVNSNDHVLILMVVAGITAAAVAFIAGILSAAYLYVTTALLPLCIHYFFSHTDYLIGLAIFIYLVFLLIQSQKIHGMLQNGLLLQFELKEAKDHDPLTNAANRHLFNYNFKHAIERAKKDRTKVFLLYFDLNKFKSINDIHGHQAGDQILVTFVDRLKSIFKENDKIARLGGDEFTVIINTPSDSEDIELVVKKINKILEESVCINGKSIKIQASLGISIYPTDGTDIETLLSVADERMYSVKKASF